MSTPPQDRAPSAFNLDDPRLKIDAAAPVTPPPELPPPPPLVSRKSIGWGSLFLSAAGGLLALVLLIWVQDTVLSLFARQDWLGWAAIGLFVVAGFALFMLIAREVVGLLRLSAMTALRQSGELALHNGDSRKARATAKAVQGVFTERLELREPLYRLKQHESDVLDARQILALTERELLIPTDRAARAAVGSTARRVAVVTSISPAALIDVAFVAYANFKMLRTLATIYGGRPGFFTILRLLRLVAGHLAVTGGMALTDDFLQQIIGHSLTAKLSRRLGEGIVNGGFTIRIGLAAIEVLRPLPYIEARSPRLREFVSEFLRFGGEKDASPDPNSRL